MRNAGVGHSTACAIAPSNDARKSLAASTSRWSIGLSLTLATKVASGLTSMPTADRPCWAAPTMIDPEPQNGSRMRRPRPSSVMSAGENPSR